MVMASFTLREDYWETFEIKEEDIEFVYNYLLEKETPLTPQEFVEILVVERIRLEKLAIEQQRSAGGDLFMPLNHYTADKQLVFPALAWQRGKVVGVRTGQNPDLGEFEVIEVEFEDGAKREYAAGLEDHTLNQPPEMAENEEALDPQAVLEYYEDELVKRVVEGLEANDDFVCIAGRWFPRALLIDINTGHLNLTEAVLDMSGGGPLPTSELLEQIELSSNVNSNLLEFSLDLALQEDQRFDEVGPAGIILWFLKRLEPEPVLKPPLYLRYPEMEYERHLLTDAMLAMERELDDELSPLESHQLKDEVEICLIFPHWRAGTLPLSSRVRHLFPTAYEAPRIRFFFVDGVTGDRFPAWVVREERYVYGLQDWYDSHGLIPGSVFSVRRGEKPGEVIINSDKRRSRREWIRTALVGIDGGVVFAMLKQITTSKFDERMVISIPDADMVDQIWDMMDKERPPFERVVVNTVRELAKLNPQSHVHAIELYAAINIVRRCPPGPILALLASRPWFVHVGDLHFRFRDSESV